MKTEVGFLDSRSNPAPEPPVFFRGRGRYRYRNRWIGSFRLQGTIFDADTDSDTDPELWFSDLFQGDDVGC